MFLLTNRTFDQLNFRQIELSANPNHDHRRRRRRRPENGVFSGCRDKLNQVFVAADVLQTFNVVPLLIKKTCYFFQRRSKKQKSSLNNVFCLR